jgi:hypothetical protein
MKFCKICKLEKEYSEFYEHPKSKDGYGYECKECNKEHYREHRRRYGRDNYHKLKKEDPLALRIKDWRDMGLIVTREQYYELYNRQEGKCYCCEKHEDELPKKLCLDHCHKTMRLRGLLCTSCNAMLGNAKDSIQVLQKAIKYLNNFNA